MDPEQYAYLIVPLIFIGFLLVRTVRGGTRRLRLELLWIVPVLVLLLVGATLWFEPAPDALALAGMGLALAAGVGVGFWRGKLTQITVDPGTEVLTSKVSAAGVILIVTAFAIRYAFRLATMEMPELACVGRVGDWFLLFVLGFVVTARLEMWIRARRIIADARAGKAA